MYCRHNIFITCIVNCGYLLLLRFYVPAEMIILTKIPKDKGNTKNATRGKVNFLCYSKGHLPKILYTKLQRERGVIFTRIIHTIHGDLF